MASIEFTPPGGADEGFKMLIHKPSVASTLAAGYALEEGDGTELPIWFNADGFGPRNAGGFKSILKSLATADRNVSLADSAGTLFPALTSTLAAPAINSTVTMIDSGLVIPQANLEANAIYEIDVRLIFRSAAASTGAYFELTGPTTETDWIDLEISYQGFAGAINLAWGALHGNTAGNTDNFLAGYKGYFKTTSTAPTSPIKLRFRSEAGGSAVTLLFGFIRLSRLN